MGFFQSIPITDIYQLPVADNLAFLKYIFKVPDL